MGVLLLLLESELVLLRVLSNADISEIVLPFKSLEYGFYILICQVLIDHTAKFSIYDENDALSQYIVVAKHVINSSLLLPTKGFWWLRN